MDPREHDMMIADLYHSLSKARQKALYKRESIFRMADAEYRYVRGNRVPDISFEEAMERLDSHLEEHSLRHGKSPLEAIEAYEDAQLIAGNIMNEIEEAEEAYTGWSRFFVVTSSAGHVHSSMSCHTCYASTEFGWIPDLSGKSEEEAVVLLGENLCSECFKSAPVAHQGGKLTQAEAKRLAYTKEGRESQDREKVAKAKKAADDAAKAITRVVRDHTLAIKVNEFVDAYGLHPDRDTKNKAYESTWDRKGYDTAYNVYDDMTKKGQ